MNLSMSDRVAVVTGGSKGIGFAVARRFAESGAKVAILARGAADLKTARETLAKDGHIVHDYVCDVSRAADITKTHDQIVADFGRIDVLVNNAGTARTMPFESISDEAWREDLDLKLFAAIRFSRLAWEGMKQRKWGRIINVLNTYAKAPAGNSAPTSVSRAAGMALTKVMAHEGGEHNILVNALLVGLIMSDQWVKRHAAQAPNMDFGEFAKMKSATRDKDLFIGDPSFVDVPAERLISKEYCSEIADRIKHGTKADVARFNAGLPSKETTQVSIRDAEGNCVSMTHSLGMPSGVITKGLGFMYNGCMGVFDPRPGRAGSLAPGKARFSSICPSIVFENDNPMLVIGAPGATQIAMGVLQVTLNVLDFGMTTLEAVSSPRSSATSNIIDLSNRVPRSIERGLIGLGYETTRSPLSHTFAWVHGIKITPDGLEGGADPATDGVALSVCASEHRRTGTDEAKIPVAGQHANFRARFVPGIADTDELALASCHDGIFQRYTTP